MIKSRTRSLSQESLLILNTLAKEQPNRWLHGYDLLRATGIKSGSLYPILNRMHQQKLLGSKPGPPAEGGRPPRRLYSITQRGISLLRMTRDPE
jgi:PadR family transcriptional regulator, regulatory protein PadR